MYNDILYHIYTLSNYSTKYIICLTSVEFLYSGRGIFLPRTPSEMNRHISNNLSHSQRLTVLKFLDTGISNMLSPDFPIYVAVVYTGGILQSHNIPVLYADDIDINNSIVLYWNKLYGMLRNSGLPFNAIQRKSFHPNQCIEPSSCYICTNSNVRYPDLNKYTIIRNNDFLLSKSNHDSTHIIGSCRDTYNVVVVHHKDKHYDFFSDKPYSETLALTKNIYRYQRGLISTLVIPYQYLNILSYPIIADTVLYTGLNDKLYEYIDISDKFVPKKSNILYIYIDHISDEKSKRNELSKQLIYKYGRSIDVNLRRVVVKDIAKIYIVGALMIEAKTFDDLIRDIIRFISFYKNYITDEEYIIDYERWNMDLIKIQYSV